MKLRNLLSSMSPEERERFAASCGTSVGHLRNVASGQKTCGESLAVNLERESRGVIRCEDMRPDVDWAYIRGTAAEVTRAQQARQPA